MESDHSRVEITHMDPDNKIVRMERDINKSESNGKQHIILNVYKHVLVNIFVIDFVQQICCCTIHGTESHDNK